MKKFPLLFLILGCSCTENIRSRHLGGTSSQNIVAGQKVVGAAWKEADLWVLTRPMRSNEVAETLEFKEFSTWGLMSGKVILIESK